MGIGVTTPIAKLDLATDENTGGFQVSTTVGGNGMSGNPPGVGISPYAMQVMHTSYNQITATFNTNTTMRILPSGQLYLGTTNNYGYSAPNYLNVPSQGVGVYNSQSDYLKLTYSVVPGQKGARINWTSTGQTGAYKNLFITNNNTPIMQFYPEGRVDITNSSNNPDLVFNIESGAGQILRVSNEGNVFIGSNLNENAFADYYLYVEKGIRAERVRVDVAASNGWADFVFEKDYQLMPIAELEAYIKQHKHLPNVPSAEEVAQDGIDLAEMNVILLRQIEELTLRVIKMQEEIEELKSENQ